MAVVWSSVRGPRFGLWSVVLVRGLVHGPWSYERGPQFGPRPMVIDPLSDPWSSVQDKLLLGRTVLGGSSVVCLSTPSSLVAATTPLNRQLATWRAENLNG